MNMATIIFICISLAVAVGFGYRIIRWTQTGDNRFKTDFDAVGKDLRDEMEIGRMVYELTAQYKEGTR